MEIERDSQFPFLTLDSYNVAVSKPAAFTGGTANTRGDKDGTKATMKIFDVTGDVIVRVFGVCTVDLVGAGTLEVGVAGNTAALIAQIADATTLDANELYYGATHVLGVATLASVLGPYLVVNGLDIDEKVGTADITAGQVYYICLWRPLTPGSKVVGVSEV